MLKKFFKDESGQGMVEYALIIALIAVVVIVAVTALGGGIKDTLSGKEAFHCIVNLRKVKKVRQL